MCIHKELAVMVMIEVVRKVVVVSLTHMLVDPLDDEVSDLEVVLVLHEHVAVPRPNSGDFWQVNIGDVTFSRFDRCDLFWAR
jgi:hypothetical protein